MNAPSNAAFRRPTLSVPFSSADFDSILQGAARVLNDVGVLCESDNIRTMLASFKGARQDGQRVYYGRAGVEEILAGMRAIPGDAAEPAFSWGGPWCTISLADAESGQIRQATLKDSADATRLLAAMGANIGVCPLSSAADVPPQMSNLSNLRTLFLHSPTGQTLTNQPSAKEIPFAREMGQVVGRKPTAFVMAMISPLRFEDKSLEYFLEHRDEPGVFLFPASGMPCVGSTAPMDLLGAMIQTVAESMASNACSATFGMDMGDMTVRCDPFDMRYGNYVIGSPEYHLLDMACRGIYHHMHGRLQRGGSFRTMAKMPDAQATHERSMTVLMQALQGARRFGGVGQLSLDEVFSPEQAVIDREILHQVERTVRGMEFRTDEGGKAALDETVDLIGRGAKAGSFLALDETLDGYRDFFTFSELFQYNNASTWQSSGGKSVLGRAAEEKQRLLKDAPRYAVSEQQAKDIEKIYLAAQKALA